MDDARCGVTIAHLRRNLALVRDEKCAGKWRIVSEGLVDRARRTEPHARQEIRIYFLRLRRVGRRCGGGERNDHRRTEEEWKPNPVRPAADNRRHARECGTNNANPGEIRKPRQQASEVGEICSGYQGQSCSNPVLPECWCLRPSARYHSIARATNQRLTGEWEGGPLRHDLSEESGPRRSGQLDLQILPDQGGIARNHHGLEIAGARLKQTTALGGFLDENLSALAQQTEVPFTTCAAHDFDQSGESVTGDIVRNGLARGEACCRRSFARRELESVRILEVELAHRAQGLVKIGFRLTRKSDDDVRRQRQTGNGSSQPRGTLEVRLASVTAKHALQRPRRPRLHRQMHVLAACRRFGDRLDYRVGEIVRMRAGEAESTHAMY